MKPKTARRFLDRNAWKITRGNDKDTSPSFWRRVNQSKVVLGADPLKLVEQNRESFFSHIMKMFGF